MNGSSPANRAYRLDRLLFWLPALLLAASAMALIRFWPQPAETPPQIMPQLKSVLEMDFSNAVKPLREKIGPLQQQLQQHPEDSRSLAALGILLMAHELKRAAIPCFEVLAQLEPEDFRWPYLLGHCRMFIAPDKAAEDFRNSSELSPEYVPAQMMLIEVLLANGRLQEAHERLLTAVPEQMQSHPWARWQMSRLAGMQGEFETAEQLLEDLRKQGIVSKSLLRQLMLVKRRTQPTGDTQTLADDLSRCPNELLTWDCPLIRAVQLERADYQAVIQQSQSFLSRGDPGAAVGVFRKAIEQDPDTPELKFHLAQLWLYLGEKERAEGALLAAATQEHGSLRILLLRCRIAMESERWQDAAEFARQAVELKPDSADAISFQAKIAFHQGRPDDGRQLAQRVLQLDPRHAATISLLSQQESP